MAIKELTVDAEMRQSYLNYAMSVIVSRALPDVKDGLKPVHRRILWSMFESGYFHNRQYRKTARVVGSVMGMYHPHGDASISDAIARMTQDFSLRYPLIDGQGNFGTIDGDPPAAMRYTECRLERIAEELLDNIREETVPFVDNFDGTEKQPEFLPGKYPNLLVNASVGIAVGMSSNMPPHNLREIIKGTIAAIDNPEITIDELMEFVPAPDLPTGGIILGASGIKEAYETGRGKFYIRAKTEIIEVNERGKDIPRIIISEIPYQVNKENLVKQLEGLTDKEPKISEVNDFSGLVGGKYTINIEIDLKPGTGAIAILNWLFKHSQLQISFGIINLALVENEPTQLPLKRIIDLFIEHRKDIIIKRTTFRKAREEKEKHKLEGFLKILDHLDDVIQIIRGSENADEVFNQLHENYDLSQSQVNDILSLQLRRLTKLGQRNIQEEFDKVVALILGYDEILGSEEKRKTIIKEELMDIDKKYGDNRKAVLDFNTQVLLSGSKVDRSKFIPEEKIVIMLTASGYIKSIPLESYKAQRRGGVGVQAMTVREGDYIKEINITSNHSRLVFFSTKGKAYEVYAYDIPPSITRTTKGISIRNLIELENDEDTVTWISVKTSAKSEEEEDNFVVMVTAKGLIKKTKISKFLKFTRRGKRVITLMEGDKLIGVRKTSGEDYIILTSEQGKANRFKETRVRPTGLSSRGVRGMRISGDNRIAGVNIADSTKLLLTITENGYGKRTKIEKYRITNRGTKGVLNIKTDERNGKAIDNLIVADDDQILIISSEGKITRIRASGIRITGRNTRGVRLMRLAKDTKIIAVGKIESDFITEEDEKKEIKAETELDEDDKDSEITDDIDLDENEDENGSEIDEDDDLDEENDIETKKDSE